MWRCRNSKLTQLLSDSLSGQAKVMMFVHVAPEATSYAESVSTLKFGARVSEITLGAASKNIERGSPLEIKEAQVRRQPRSQPPLAAGLVLVRACLLSARGAGPVANLRSGVGVKVPVIGGILRVDQSRHNTGGILILR